MATRLNLALLVYQLIDAGLAAVPLNCGADGQIDFPDPATPQATKDAVMVVVNAHNPDDPVPDRDDVRDKYVIAKAAMVTFAGNRTLANAGDALIKLGQSHEALLLYLNKRIA